MTTGTRDVLLHAATRLMLEQGYNGTTVAQICAAAGTTKGAFFHYFKNKDEMGLATIDRYAFRIFSVMRAGAAKRPHDPVAQVFDYVEALGQIGYKPGRKPACLLAIETMELGLVRPDFRERCEAHFADWQRFFQELLEAAIASLPHTVEASASELAAHFISVFEGSLILARARADAKVIETNLRQFSAGLELVFRAPKITN